jgi:hypothetical protein
MFSAPQKFEEEHLVVQLVDAWQVLAPPMTVSLHTVVPARDSQSLFDMQYTEISR